VIGLVVSVKLISGKVTSHELLTKVCESEPMRFVVQMSEVRKD